MALYRIEWVNCLSIVSAAVYLYRADTGLVQGCQVWPFRGPKNKFCLFLIGGLEFF